MRPPHAALGLAAVLLVSGCLGLGGPSQPPSDQRAIDALDRAEVALNDVKSYRATVDGQVEARSTDNSITVEFSMDERTNISSQMSNATVALTGLPGPMNSRTLSVHLLDYTAYTECARTGWGQTDLSESRDWVTYTSLGQQLALLNRSNVYWEGGEAVADAETSVITAHPTKEQLQNGLAVRGSGATDFEGASVDNATITLWIDNDTDRPVQVRRHIVLSGDGTTATATATFRFTGYNEPTPVSVSRVDNVWETSCPGA